MDRLNIELIKIAEEYIKRDIANVEKILQSDKTPEERMDDLRYAAHAMLHKLEKIDIVSFDTLEERESMVSGLALFLLLYGDKLVQTVKEAS